MKFKTLVDMLDAYLLIMPGLGDQELYNVSISSDGEIKFSLDERTISIPIS